jgi:hypothetical protein
MPFNIKNITGGAVKKQNIVIIYNDGHGTIKKPLRAQEEMVLNVPTIPASIKKLEMSGLIYVSFVSTANVKPKSTPKPKITTKAVEAPKKVEKPKKEVIKEESIEEPIKEEVKVETKKRSRKSKSKDSSEEKSE